MNQGGNVQALARVLFTQYFFPFEATSVLLIVAAIAAMVLGRRRIAEARSREAEIGAERRRIEAAPPSDRSPCVRTPIAYFLMLSGVLFAIGTVGVLVRRNALVIFMSVELQLNAVNLALVAFCRMHDLLTARCWRSSRWWWRPPRSWWASRSSCACTGGAGASNVDDAKLLKW